MNAERVFFVEDNPVIVFTEIPGKDPAEDLVEAYRRAWSMARPRCLFIATDDEIRVYSLSSPPVSSADKFNELTPLQIVTRTADVAEQLADFRRDKIEDGSLFERAGFAAGSKRADTQFLEDVERATEMLESQGMSQHLAHGLIERVVLIRYLEDRAVLTPEYYERIAARRQSWLRAIRSQRVGALGSRSLFLECLEDIDLTREIFRDLARTFNGDLFVPLPEEESISSAHLLAIQRLFNGEGFTETRQEPLFLWAYDFSVVPTSLISSMYEQFYHADSSDDSGTYYTPSELVEYVLARTLTEKVLDQGPRVCDAACGSGIFLVEAFRRIVRHEMVSDPAGFTRSKLRKLLVERVAGVDNNAEAVRLAAFSLYLAYLNYLSPPDILSADPLPRLISRENADGEATVLVISDAFNETTTEASDKLTDLDAIPWSNGSFDVVVGNPPWTEPRSQRRRSLPDKWASDRDLPVGDRSLSQLFLWRALSLLRTGGIGSLLVAATTFHNVRSKSFRDAWLREVRLQAIVNFTPARRLFFNDAIAPFALVQFEAGPPEESLNGQGRFEYLTLVPSRALAASGSLSYARTERKWIRQSTLRNKDYLWKTYFWGSHRDAALMLRLDAESRLRDVLPPDAVPPSYGFQWGDKRDPSPALAALPALKRMESWGAIKPEWLESVTRRVKREPDERLYSGPRILISRGVKTGFGPRVRFLDDPLAFRHTYYCVPTGSLTDDAAKAIAGVLLSSLGRYRLFMTSASWGLWHDSVTPDDILSIPVRLGAEYEEQIRLISSTIDSLMTYSESDQGLFATKESVSLDGLFRQLDETVYDLFELVPAERALVDDFHQYTLDLATKQEKSAAIAPIARTSAQPELGTRATLDESDEISRYLDIFLSIWNRELSPDGEFSWRLISPPHTQMLAVVFETRSLDERLPTDTTELWSNALRRLQDSLSREITHSIRTEGVVRSVSDTSIVVIKRNEARLWSPSAAIDDAEATLLQAMNLGA